MSQFITQEKLGELVSEFKPHNMSSSEFQNILIEQAKQRGDEIEGVNATFSIPETLRNIPGSAKQFVKDVYVALSDPLGSIKSTTALTKGFIQNIAGNLPANIRSTIPGLAQVDAGGAMFGISDEQADAAFDGMVKFLKDSYGGTDKILNTIEKDPIGFGADLASSLGVLGASVGKMSKLGKVARFGQAISKYSEFAEPVKMVGGLTKLTGKTARATFRIVNKAMGWDDWFKRKATKQAGKGMALPRAEQKALVRIFGQQPSEWIAEIGAGGNPRQLHRQMTEILNKSSNALNERLASVTDIYRHAPPAEKLLERIDGVLKNMEHSKAVSIRKTAQKTLEKLRTEGLTLVELNEVKRLFDREFPKAFTKGGLPAQSRRLNEMAGLRLDLQNLIESEGLKNGIPDVKAINKQTQKALILKDWLDTELNVIDNRNPFVDRMIMAGGAVGSVLSGDPRLIAGAAAFVGGESIYKSLRFRTAVSNQLYLMAESKYKRLEAGIEFSRDKIKINKEAKNILRQVIENARKATLTTAKGRLSSRAVGVIKQESQ